MKIFKNLLILSSLSLVAFTVSGCIGTNTISNQPNIEDTNTVQEQPPAIFSLEEQEFDFGVLKQSGGVVSHEFSFQYNGEEPFVVTGVPTSCACTSAEISPKEYKKGDKGIVTVHFDPNLHEEPVGKFFKTISLITEPTMDQTPELKIWAEIDLDLGEEAYKLKEAHVD